MKYFHSVHGACIYLWYQPGLNPVTHGEIFLVLHYIPAWVRKVTNCLLLLKFLCIYKKKKLFVPSMARLENLGGWSPRLEFQLCLVSKIIGNGLQK